MKILITNDDGIQVDALEALAEALGEEHQIWVVAPDGNRSGQSMSITLHHHLMVKEIKPRWFSCSGTPTDCVLLVALGALGEKPDLIISGINYGPNMGTDLLYSGTAAAARQGTLKGIPSMAFSLDQMEGPYDFIPAINYIKQNIGQLYQMTGKGYFLNINFPKTMKENPQLRFARPCDRKYRDSFESFDPPRGPRYFFPHGYIDNSDPPEGTDLAIVLEGNIAFSPIIADPQVHEEIDAIEQRLAALEDSCG